MPKHGMANTEENLRLMKYVRALWGGGAMRGGEVVSGAGVRRGGDVSCLATDASRGRLAA